MRAVTVGQRGFRAFKCRTWTLTFVLKHPFKPLQLFIPSNHQNNVLIRQIKVGRRDTFVEPIPAAVFDVSVRLEMGWAGAETPIEVVLERIKQIRGPITKLVVRKGRFKIPPMRSEGATRREHATVSLVGVMG